MHKDRIEHNCIWLWIFSELFALLIRTAKLSGLPPQRKEVNDSKSNKQLSEKYCLTLSAGLFIAIGEAQLFYRNFHEIQPFSDSLKVIILLIYLSLKKSYNLLFLLKERCCGVKSWKISKETTQYTNAGCQESVWGPQRRNYK